MREYWNGVWATPDLKKYLGYVEGYTRWNPRFLEIFAEHGVENFCDAACGFGAYSMMMAKKGYTVSGFDISTNAVDLTQKMLQAFECDYGTYKVCKITDFSPAMS